MITFIFIILFLTTLLIFASTIKLTIDEGMWGDGFLYTVLAFFMCVCAFLLNIFVVYMFINYGLA